MNQISLACLTVIAALTLATEARAVELDNKEVSGTWCKSQGYNGLYNYIYGDYDNADEAREAREKCGHGILSFKRSKHRKSYPEGYEEWKSECKFVSVKTWYDPTIPTATQTPPGALVSRTISRCKGEGGSWREEMIVHMGKGFLSVKKTKLGTPEIPQQYRGHWCASEWETIYRRCPEGSDDLAVERTGYGTEDSGCTLDMVREDKRYGGHRIEATCREDKPGGEEEHRQERWWLGSHGTRLQILQMRSK
jgi:hypothetical protein